MWNPFNPNKKELKLMAATLASIDAKLTTGLASILTAVSNISTGDQSAVLAAIADLKTDVDTNVEGGTTAGAGTGQ